MKGRTEKKQFEGIFLVKSMATILVAVGLILLLINVYGLTQPIRKPGLGVTDQDQLRFIPEEVWSYEKSLTAIAQLSEGKSVRDLVGEANRIVNKSLIHIEWIDVDPHEYRQLVPIWENYFLWAIGTYSGLPQFERYHYANYERNIRRGIGICGDASTVLSSILDNYRINNRIISFNGHVIVEYQDELGKRYLADPDFGVEMEGNLEQLVRHPDRFRKYYSKAGYPPNEVNYLFAAYQTRFAIYDDTFHFMTKRYIFEEVSYVIKWLLPIILLLLSGVCVWWSKRANGGAIKA